MTKRYAITDRNRRHGVTGRWVVEQRTERREINTHFVDKLREIGATEELIDFAEREMGKGRLGKGRPQPA